MKHYFGTKQIKATPMNREEYNNYRGWDVPEDENPEDEGFLVEYLDSPNSNHPDHEGYISWSPKEVFEEAYKSSGEMTFGHALEALKLGKKVARKGWNGKGMFLYYVPANSYPAQTAIAKQAFPEGEVPYGAYIAMKTAQGNVIPWLASQTDMLSNDWEIIE